MTPNFVDVLHWSPFPFLLVEILAQYSPHRETLTQVGSWQYKSFE